jgi:Calcineurin-like phosphoesterase
LNFNNYSIITLLAVLIFTPITILFNNNFFDQNHNINKDNDIRSSNFLQNSYAAEKDGDEDNDEDEDEENNSNINKKDKSIFNIVAAGDYDCNGDAEDTVENIIDQDPEIVLALGDFSYSGGADCWLDLIEPIADKTKIVFGNHEDHSEEDYMDFFGLKEQYYSFNYKNVHFLALSTETDYDDDSEQYQFAIRDLEKYSKDPFIDWIIVFYHRHIYGSGSGLPEETDFRESYHPLFDKYKVDLALQGHLHFYERTYPISFNDDDDDEPLLLDNNPNFYKNPKGLIFVTVGTGGAHDMPLSSLKDFSAEGIDGKFGILDITLEPDQKTLTGTFIENGKKKKVLDEFKIVKDIS